MLNPINEKDFELVFENPFKKEEDDSFDENIYPEVLFVDEGSNKSSGAQMSRRGSTEFFGMGEDVISQFLDCK